MTNREILAAAREALVADDWVKQLALRTESETVSCPACGTPVDALTAAGLDIDDFEMGIEREFRCPHCRAELRQVEHCLTGPAWYWQLKDTWLQEQLRKARVYDALTTRKEGGHES